MGNSFYFPWEVDLIEWLQQSMGSIGKTASSIFSFVGGVECSLFLLIAILFCYKKESGVRITRTLLTASMWFPMVKNVVLRIRPYMDHPERIKVLQVVEPDADPMDIVQQGYSFPSGHGAMAVSMYGGIGMEVRKRWMWALAIIIPILIGASRITVGVHYPTDVLAG